MNKVRRKQIAALNLKLRDIADALADIRAEEAVALENMPESLQDAPAGIAMADAIDTIDDIVDRIAEAHDDLELEFAQ